MLGCRGFQGGDEKEKLNPTETEIYFIGNLDGVDV
jgi:hypothetical protein